MYNCANSFPEQMAKGENTYRVAMPAEKYSPT